MSQPKSNSVRSIIIVFIIVTFVSIVFRNQLMAWKIDWRVVLGGNLILFFISLFTTTLTSKAIDSTNLHAFTRNVNLGFIIRLFVCAAAAGIYFVAVGKANVNRYALLICMLIYFVYTFIEVSTLRKLLKEKSNA